MENKTGSKLYLASTSPRRKELVAQLGAPFTCMAPNVDEIAWPGEAPASFALRAATEKAEAVRAQIAGEQNYCIVSADTVVVIDGEILGKPRDLEHAKHMLHKLSGRRHVVITGLCILKSGQCGELLRGEAVHSEVRFKQLTKADIDSYVMGGEPMDKAGAYGIQGEGAAFIADLKGSYTNVMGLPMEILVDLLEID